MEKIRERMEVLLLVLKKVEEHALSLKNGLTAATYDIISRNDSNFVKSRFCCIHFTVILAELKKIVRYTEDYVI